MFWNKQPKPSTEAEFDIEGVDVFSVERDPDGSTRFGYRRLQFVTVGTELQSYPVDDEWVVMSTDEQHRTFVARLSAKLKAESLQQPIQ